MTVVKQNRVLLIFLGIAFVLALGFLLPGYFDCHAPHLWPKSSRETETESAELYDLKGIWHEHAAEDGVINLEVDHETMIVEVRDREPVLTLKILQPAWEEIYARYHGLTAATVPCLRVVVRDERGKTIASGVNRDSVYRVFTHDYVWYGTEPRTR